MNFSVNNWLPFLIPEKGRRWLGMMLFHMALTAVIGILLPGITEDFYQDFQKDALTPFLVLGGLFLAEYVNRLGYQISTYKYVQHLLGETRARTFGLWMRAPLKIRRKGQEDEFPMGEVLARIMSDSDAVKELVTSGAFAIFIDFVFIVSALIGFLRLDAGLGGGLFFLELVACVLLIWGSRKMGVIFASVRQSTGYLSRVVTDVTQGLRELAFTPHAKYASKRGDRVFDDFLQKQLKSNVWDAGYYSAAESLYPILLALVLFFFPDGQGAKLALLAVLIDLIQKSITPIKEVAGKISSIQRAKTGVERILDFQMHFAQDELNTKSDVIELNEFKVRVDYYAYPPREGESAFELKNIVFSGKPGELIGIVGSSGCGKSTLLRLLSGQHGSFQGIMKLNDLSLSMEKNADLFQLCQQVSLVSQDSHVFSASVRFNVALSEDSLDFDEFWQKAQAALPYLRRWGITPTSVIDPKTLSLGQKQLLSGLRACYLRKPIVLFDEVSSGLDPDLERALRDLVLFVQQHSLTIIVTHRVETILSAQRLVVMDAGVLVDIGTPAELSQRSDLFKDFLKHLAG
ncbi:MAG: ATP-binding cassette domain-containing protein [Bacteriovoracia bacterium]